MPTTLNFDAFESRLESCDAALTSLQETQGRMKGHIADCLESSTKVTIAARKAVEICETLVEKGPERHSLYIAAATSANRPANKRLSVAERVRLAHAALAAE